jgi:hypothetical protein
MTGAIVRSSLGDCHLVDDFAPSSWPRADVEPVFADDDLRVSKAGCSCGQLYLLITRRVRQDVWKILVPVSNAELETFSRRVAAVAPSYNDEWHAAEAGVLALTRTHPFLEHSSRPPEVLRWCPPGEPLAFKFSPM